MRPSASKAVWLAQPCGGPRKHATMPPGNWPFAPCWPPSICGPWPSSAPRSTGRACWHRRPAIRPPCAMRRWCCWPRRSPAGRSRLPGSRRCWPLPMIRRWPPTRWRRIPPCCWWPGGGRREGKRPLDTGPAPRGGRCAAGCPALGFRRVAPHRIRHSGGWPYAGRALSVRLSPRCRRGMQRQQQDGQIHESKQYGHRLHQDQTEDLKG